MTITLDRAVTRTHVKLPGEYGKKAISNWGNNFPNGRAMAKKRYLIYRKNRVKIPNSVEQKLCLNRWSGYCVVWQWDTLFCFYYFPDVFKQKRVFMKTTCSPRGPPIDLHNVKNSLEPPSPRTTPKMTTKPTNLMRNESIQFTATTYVKAAFEILRTIFLHVFSLSKRSHAWPSIMAVTCGGSKMFLNCLFGGQNIN